MKFKIGQKVRVVEWIDMSQEMQDVWGINQCNIGITGVIKDVKVDKGIEEIYGVNTYDVVFNSNPLNTLFAFEPELEPLVKVGEQLEFGFMEK